MDQVHVIRHKVLVEGHSIRAVAQQIAVSRNTVRKYLKQSEPVRKEEGPRARPVLDVVAPVIEEIKVEEEGSRDVEVGHAGETVGYLVIGTAPGT